jgi:hypothetical protein
MEMHTSDDIGTGMALGFPGHCGSRLAPLAMDSAKRKLDARLLSVTLGGLSQKQIDELDFAADIGLTRVRRAIRALVARWR